MSRSAGQPTDASGVPIIDAALVAELRSHVEVLAGDIGIRHVGLPDALESAARHVESHLARAGYEVRTEPFDADGHPVRNVVAEVPGERDPEKILIVGAHYDSYPETPGADDNASGVAALLALARALRGRALAHTVRFVAFVNEEPPWFLGPYMGSRVHARGCRERGEHLIGMISLEMLGYYSDEPGSQGYPLFLSLLYPRTANFIALVANLSSRRLLKRSRAFFQATTDFPVVSEALPAWVPGVSSSDQAAFWQEGYAGFMVTDTANFRYVHYHGPGDKPENLDYHAMSRVVTGIQGIVEGLAGGVTTGE